MKLIYLVTLSVFYISSEAYGDTACGQVEGLSGTIRRNGVAKRYFAYEDHLDICWFIEVPHSSYIQLRLVEMNFMARRCYDGYILIKESKTKREHVFCPADSTWSSVRVKDNVTIHFFLRRVSGVSNFTMLYNIESLTCESMDNFRCSNHTCISSNKTCDGVKDCENGKDEIACESQICKLNKHFRCSEENCIPGTQVCDGKEDCENGTDEIGCGFDVRLSRESAIAWLKERRSTTFGWGVNTHRAVTALYLSGGANFEGGNSEEELMAKQLELQTSNALLRNSSSILSVNELSMFINALTASCHSPRQFYKNDLVLILKERIRTSKSSTPGPYLTLCIANWEFSESDIKLVLKTLNMYTGYPFERDIQAMTVMALTCIKNKTKGFDKVTNATEMYNATIKNFIASQQPNGSFGNVHTTALVAQALISAGKEYTKAWNTTATMNYLMMKLNSSSDFLTTILSLPVLNSKSLIDVGYRNCTEKKKHVDGEINGVINKLGGKVRVKYSLFIGDDKDLIHSITLRLSEKSSALDLMRVAAIAVSKYKFLHTDISGHMYVYDIAGIANDPEAGKFWFSYIGQADSNESVIHQNISPDKLILNDNEHFIMWYKTANTPE